MDAFCLKFIESNRLLLPTLRATKELSREAARLFLDTLVDVSLNDALDKGLVKFVKVTIHEPYNGKGD
jgi:hypothetical protein